MNRTGTHSEHRAELELGCTPSRSRVSDLATTLRFPLVSFCMRDAGQHEEVNGTAISPSQTLK